MSGLTIKRWLHEYVVSLCLSVLGFRLDNLSAREVVMPWMLLSWLQRSRDMPVSRVTQVGAHAGTEGEPENNGKKQQQQNLTQMGLQICDFHSVSYTHTHVQLLISFQ